MNRRSLLLAVMLLAATVTAQQPQPAPQPRVDDAIEVSIVSLDVVVTGKDGTRVTGLTADDFEIREAGTLQPITNFAEYTPAIMAGRASIEAGQEGQAAARPQRTIVVFIESARLAPFDAKQMFDGIRGLLWASVAAGDRATILEWRRGILIRQDFTNDLTKLDAVLGVMEQEQVHGPRDRSDDVQREQAESDQTALQMGARGMPPVHSLDAAVRQRNDIRQKGRVLEAVMNSISAADGRKIMILALRRFGVHAGAEFFPGSSVPFDRRGELSTVDVRDAVIRTANANNIALYPIYAPGLRWAGVKGGVFNVSTADDLEFGAQEGNKLLNEATALDNLARDTGGLVAWGAANIAEMLPRVADDLETYYSLAYRAPASGKDVTRRIEVRAKNPQYTVRSRRQFVEKSDETRMKDRLVANLYQLAESSAIPFEVTLGKLKSHGRNRWDVPVRIRIPIRALATVEQGRHETGEFSVYVVSGRSLGVASEVLRRSQPFRIPRADLARARGSYFTYDVDVRIDEKSDRISIGVVDERTNEAGLQRIALPPRVTARAAMR